jgi:hypothetical protein
MNGEDNGLPYYRANCQRCNAADGRLRHAPPPSPVSGVWCDRCHRHLELLRWLVPAGIVAGAVLLGLTLTG